MPRKKQPSATHRSKPAQRPAKQQAVRIPAWLPELEKWEQAKYDGVKGFPPPWVPDPHRKRFNQARSILFFFIEEKKATYAEIRSRFDFLAQNKYGAIALAPIKDTKPYDDALYQLVELYKACSLDPIEGLLLLAGETAVAGFRVRTGYKKREEFLDRPEVQQLAGEHWANHPDATITDIIKSPALASYRRRYKGKHTLRTWLNAVDPRPPEAKRGRPKNRK